MAKKKILTDNGQEILPITHESCVLDNNGVSIGSKIGNINELATDSRTDLVSAINDILEFKDSMKQEAEELKQEMTNIKQELVNALTAKGIEASNSDSFDELLNKINNNIVNSNVTAGDSIQLLNLTNGSFKLSKDDEINTFKFTSNVKGSIKVMFKSVCSSAGFPAYIVIDLIRNGEIISTNSIKTTNYGSYMDIEHIIDGIQLDDVVSIHATNAGITSGSTGGIIISCDRM